jgi:hypothetical protein
VRAVHDSYERGKSTIAQARSVLTSQQCDKSGRSDINDPCSECRHFGGAGCKCVLHPVLTYNDVAWGQMMLRHEFGFNLAQPKTRDAPGRVKKNKKGEPKSAPKIPGPMPDNELMANWIGETKAQLLAKPDFLPPQVRSLPRAYLVPPRQNLDRIRRNAQYGYPTVTSASAAKAPSTPATMPMGASAYLPAGTSGYFPPGTLVFNHPATAPWPGGPMTIPEPPYEPFLGQSTGFYYNLQNRNLRFATRRARSIIRSLNQI